MAVETPLLEPPKTLFSGGEISPRELENLKTGVKYPELSGPEKCLMDLKD